ncbi:hypothetical protein GCM10010232_66450 [Streptomyces amakusaensis]
MFLGHLMDLALEGGVLRDELLDGLAGDHLVEVPQVSQQFSDAAPLREDFVLAAGQFFLGVECPLSPRRFNAVVLVLDGPVMTALAVVNGGVDECAGLGVLVEECGGDTGALGDGADGEPAALAAELADGLADAVELVEGLATAGGRSGCGLALGRGHDAAVMPSASSWESWSPSWRASSLARKAVDQTLPK